MCVLFFIIFGMKNMNLPVCLINILFLLLIAVIIYYDISKITVCFLSTRFFMQALRNIWDFHSTTTNNEYNANNNSIVQVFQYASTHIIIPLYCNNNKDLKQHPITVTLLLNLILFENNFSQKSKLSSTKIRFSGNWLRTW